MILEYKCKNFMSFEDEIEFTAFPTRLSNKYKDNFFSYYKNCHASKSAVIFGENAGGKTNFIKSLEFLKNFILGKIDRKLYNGLTYLKNDEKQVFYLKCLIEGKIYNYYLWLDKNGILCEICYISDLNETNMIILKCFFKDTKLISEIEYLSEETQRIIKKFSSDIKVENVVDKSGQNSSAVRIKFELPSKIDYTCREDWNDPNKFVLEIMIETFYSWLNNNLIIELNEQTDKWINNIERTDSIIKIIGTEEFLEIFKIIDSSISSIKIDENKPFEYSQIIRKTEDNREFIVDLKDDSMGVREFFRLAINLYKVIYNNCVIVADEVDKVLNVIISNKIIKLVHGSEHHGQFIFTTHNIMNLNTRFFEKSQIYFVTKKEDELSSELYSLADFKDFRSENKDVYKYYLKGMFGGTPNV